MNIDELKAEAKGLGILGIGNAKPETIQKKIDIVKSQKAQTEPQAMRREPVHVNYILKKNVSERILGVRTTYYKGDPLPQKFRNSTKIEEFKKRGII